MIYYVRYENFAIAVESDDELQQNTNFMKIKKVYQLLSVPSNVVTSAGTKETRNVKLLKFDHENPDTFPENQCDGTFLLNMSGANEVFGLKDWPQIDEISKEEFRRIQIEILKEQRKATRSTDKI